MNEFLDRAIPISALCSLLLASIALLCLFFCPPPSLLFVVIFSGMGFFGIAMFVMIIVSILIE